MKTYIKIIIFCIAIGMVSCSNPSEMLTVIRSDGSCYRIFSELADSAFMTGSTAAKDNPFPVELKDNWVITWKYKNGSVREQFPITPSQYDSIIIAEEGDAMPPEFWVFARQDYKSVEDMARRFQLKSSHEWSNMDVRYSVEKKFRLFYTDYIYRETYPQVKWDFDIPLEEYMTAEEAGFWFSGEPDLARGMNGIEMREYAGALEEKYNRWFAHNLWNRQYGILLDHYAEIENPPVSKERLKSLRDTIFLENIQAAPDINMKQALERYFQSDRFSPLWEMEDSPMNKWENEFYDQDFIKYLDKSFVYKLVMPGKIQYTNGLSRNDTLLWRLTAYRMYNDDYVIEAHSRKWNVWMWFITGGFIISAVVLFFVKRKKSVFHRR